LRNTVKLLIPLFLSIASYIQAASWPILAGSEEGLFGLDWSGNSAPLPHEGSVKKIIKTQNTWISLGSGGIQVSEDLENWEARNTGLPVKTIKIFKDGEKSFLPVVQDIKDLELCPGKAEVMACATKDRVYLSRDAGRSWSSLGAPPYRTNGIKAVAAARLPVEGAPALVVFASHSTYGIHYTLPDRRDGRWRELNRGLETLETTDNPDEVSDLAVSRGFLYAGQTFRRRLYRLDWDKKVFTRLWTDGSSIGTVDSLVPRDGGVLFVQDQGVMELDLASGQSRPREDLNNLFKNISRRLESPPDCFFTGETVSESNLPVSLSELWLLRDRESGDGGKKTKTAWGRKRLYLPVNHALDRGSLKPYLDILESRKLDMVVIDMKDDYGRLRFTPEDPLIRERGRVFSPVNLEEFLRTMKERNIYTAARIVVFKDPELARKAGGKYAVWDRRLKKPWVGYYDTRRKKGGAAPTEHQRVFEADDPAYEILRTYYDERWVDPYSEDVWDYTAAIARELRRRGFDEIQFDYIRFPTDGANLADAQYRWQDPGMDMESAILSFLRHIRSQVEPPVSIDIYGANGWYRTGARTGQEVEMLAPWVDVVCPMYYPSHFEQGFLAQSPPEQRPYRIYYQGTRRTEIISRGRVIVRPYAQAFYLNVSYDRRYYNPGYVRLEAEGVRDAGGPGLTYWNNSGRYDDIPAP